MRETFTHGWILYTLFDSFVNHILLDIVFRDGLAILAGFGKFSLVCW
jgi:hypothetical protein